mmetsp:Transcript_29132/g.65944  ORF Transcript_29132/g.65944 Transcript_29132/m.65944 type:complete len:83 (-) Transcript_29132:189-437(-)
MTGGELSIAAGEAAAEGSGAEEAAGAEPAMTASPVAAAADGVSTRCLLSRWPSNHRSSILLWPIFLIPHAAKKLLSSNPVGA